MKMSSIINTDELTRQVKNNLSRELGSNLEDLIFAQIMTKQALTKYLGVEKSTVNYLVENREKLNFPVIDLGVGKQLRFPKRAIDKWILENYAALNNIYK